MRVRILVERVCVFQAVFPGKKHCIFLPYLHDDDSRLQHDDFVVPHVQRSAPDGDAVAVDPARIIRKRNDDILYEGILFRHSRRAS